LEAPDSSEPGSRAPSLSRRALKRPLSMLSAAGAAALILFVVVHLARQGVYVEELNFVDATTLLMVAVLVLRSLYKLRRASDLQAVSLALIASLSFVFGFEAIYKWSFYIFPWKMPPAELREWVIQIAVGMVAISGFAQGIFHFTRASLISAVGFLFLWLLWLALGFPQLWNGQAYYQPLLPVTLEWNMIYLLNRAAKLAFFLIYFFLYA